MWWCHNCREGECLLSTPERTFSDDRTVQIAVSARLIGKVYEADPLKCPKCKVPTRVVALLKDAAIIVRIIEHLGRWAPQATQRSPPLGPEAW
jgi:hypothetical protein